ncbi:MAG: ATP-binding protein [Planctomycetes bacterium]|nr:ATP-binding protein [Planctomycetota bacterium]
MLTSAAAKTVQDRLAEPARFLQVLIGPRQVGKTTLVEQVLERSDLPVIYAAADLPAPPGPEWVLTRWEEARQKAAHSKRAILVLDEVQKVFRWSEVVKGLWDEDRKARRDLRVMLLGSSALLLSQGLEESLAGRFELIRLTHWTYPEMREAFGWDWQAYVYFGGYPGPAALRDDEARWRAYLRDSIIETTIARDVLLLSRVEKPALLRQLFFLACEYAGQIVSYTKMLGQLVDAGNVTTLAHYQRLLEGAEILRGLPKWRGAALGRRASIPKWIPLNPALVSVVVPGSFEEARKDRMSWGRRVEAALGAHLVNTSRASETEVFYFRDGNDEVDFVLKRGKELIGLEVKTALADTAVSGLGRFLKLYPKARGLVVGPDPRAIEEALEKPAGDWFRR